MIREKIRIRIQHVFNIVLGSVFCLSSFLKAVNLNAFSIEVSQYMLSYIVKVPFKWIFICAICICVLEAFCGVLSFYRQYRKIACYIIFSMLTLFMYLTARNAFFSLGYFERIESCGCFGELIHLTPNESFAKCLILWLMSAYLIFPTYIIMKKKNNMLSFIFTKLRNLISDGRIYIILLLNAIPTFFSIYVIDKINKDDYIPSYICVCCVVVIVNILLFLTQSIFCKNVQS